MHPRWRFGLILSLSWCGALALLAGLLLAGCDTNRPPLNTAPLSKLGVRVVQGAAATPGDSTTDLAPRDLATSTQLGGPLAGLDAADMVRFTQGQDDFVEIDGVDDGLGPIFNESACVTCHNTPVGGTTGRVETRFGRMISGHFDPMTSQGGSLMQDHAIGAVQTANGAYTFVPEVVPAEATIRTWRLTTPLFGLGLVDAVPDAQLLQLAQWEARTSPSTRGVPNLVTELKTGALHVGRFGWKAQVPTLHQFAGDAYLNEMGITSPEFPNESDPQGDHDLLKYNPAPNMNDDGTDIQKAADFMTFLGPPPRGARTEQTDDGARVFRQIGCANCHVPTMTTGDSPVQAIAHRSFQPYSDFLLHDMGRLGDGIAQGQASGRQMRTAPLWGLTARPAHLHDGRAKTPQEAILMHAGQGADARNRFQDLDWRSRTSLIAFLRSL
jgi:CxxC motif-containing protein (DUF1111 family)